MMAERKKYNRITLPWALTTEGAYSLLKAWKNATDARDFCEKNNIDKNQWKKVQSIVQKLRDKGFKIKKMTYHANDLDEINFEQLKKVAKELGMY
jgi:hypothetical protein